MAKDELLASLKKSHNAFAKQMSSIDYIDDAFPQQDKKVQQKNNIRIREVRNAAASA